MAEVDASLEKLLERDEWHAKNGPPVCTSASVFRLPDLW
jgi:hypothetical protein